MTVRVVEGVPYPNYQTYPIWISLDGRRYFTRGLPNPKRSYDALGHYPGYCIEFPLYKS